MYIKYIILLFVTFYVLAVNSIDEREIEMIWDTIRGDSNFINYDLLSRHYKDEDSSELLNVVETYGYKNVWRYLLNVEHKMTFIEFKMAASDGCIHICSKTAILTVFKEIIQNDKGREYIIEEELIKYYESIISETKLIQIMQTYGQSQGIQKLEFPEFRKAVDFGDLPKPLRDEAAINAEIEQLFNRIKADDVQDYITDTDMCCYFDEAQNCKLLNVMESYGYVSNSYYRMTIDGFKNAASAGCIPRFSLKLMNDEFKKIIPKDEKREIITPEELNEYYKTRVPASKLNLSYIISNFVVDYDGEIRLDFYNFSKAMNRGFLPELFYDKITAMYTVFKKIIPEENRNYAVLDDMIDYYESEISKFTLKRLMEKHGTRHGGQHRLSFLDFKRAINFNDIPFPQ
ncbi:uncharacterized protein LOC126834278 [Adelges cooleyi]|uniref:uncharacterized protein LOC126834278 n=1 Tax=Adelges cooleyi TaxID=133065 RepID=UPI00217FD5C0|nr:uncharacterized protein LOC126834278 [Adelges cooleyi]